MSATSSASVTTTWARASSSSRSVMIAAVEQRNLSISSPGQVTLQTARRCPTIYQLFPLHWAGLDCGSGLRRLGRRLELQMMKLSSHYTADFC